MGSRLKEDEKNEKAIRALLRKPSNRRCINCNSLGPQYVCLNFSTFVCTRCSGIHREFTHRVKSVSMSKFSSQEVANLEGGGNESARATFFKDWDSQRQPFPDSSNEERLREFIKMVYVIKRFSGERPLARNRGGDREESYDNRRSDPRSNYRADSRSPSYEERNADYGRNSNAGYDDRQAEEQGARFNEKRSPARFESERGRYERNYNETRRYDERPHYETRSRKQYEDRYNEGLDRRFEDRKANEKGSRGYGNSSPPPVRPVKEILGDDVPPLRVDSPESQANGSRNTDKQQISQDDRGQRFGSSSSFGSVDGNTPAVGSSVKREDSTSLIDFSAELDPPAPKEQPDPFDLKSATQPAVDPLNNTGWATFEPAATALSLGALPQAPAVSAVHGLFGGLAMASPSLGPVGQAPAVPSFQGRLGDFGNPSNLGDGNLQWATQWTAPGVQPVDASGHNWSSSSTVSSQSWNAFPTTVSDSSSSQAAQGSQPLDSVNANNTTAATTQVIQAQPSRRPEIHEDLFKPVQNMGNPRFASQYSPMDSMGFMPQGSYNQPQNSSNPFDLPADFGSDQVSREFPSLSSMHQALPTLSMGLRPSSGPGFSAHGSHWGQTSTRTSPQALYPSASMSTGGSLFPQQPQTVLLQSMQGSFEGDMPGTSLGVSMGMNVPGRLGNPDSFANPKQGLESFLPASTFQTLLGEADFMFPSQGAPGQNTAGLTSAGNLTSADSFTTGLSGLHPLLSQSSIGSSSIVQGVDPPFPSQPLLSGQLLVAHSSLGSLSSMNSSDAVQGPLFPSHPVGNPFS